MNSTLRALSTFATNNNKVMRRPVPVRSKEKRMAPPAKDPNLPVDGVDKFAQRWMASLASQPEEGTVFSPVGLWPLLAIHADVATPEVRAGLLAAIVPDSQPAPEPQELTDAALKLLKHLDETDGVAALAGVWARGIVFKPDFVTSLPAGMVDVLSGDLEKDRAALRAWADKVFKGMVSFQPGLSEDTTAYLASAVVMSTSWDEEFRRKDGRLELGYVQERVYRVRSNKDITTVRIPGCKFGDYESGFSRDPGGLGNHDVYLVLGKEGEGPSSVLPKGLEAIRGAVKPYDYDEIVNSDELPEEGPGLRIAFTDGRPMMYVDLITRSFYIKKKTKLDLAVCGLPSKPPQGVLRQDFPGMSNSPTFVSAVTQRAFAQFTRRGFTAGALSEMDDNMSGFPCSPAEKVILEIMIDRPFGFLALDHKSGLLLFAGWVTEKEFTTKDPGE